MKKLLAFLTAVSILCSAFLISCGGSSGWSQEKAYELTAILPQEITPDQFNEALALANAGWEKIKEIDFRNQGKKPEYTDEEREFGRTYNKLTTLLETSAYSLRTRTGSSEYVDAYNEFKERVSRERKENYEKAMKATQPEE